VEGGEPRLTLA